MAGWSGDRASLLSSSRDELSPPAPFGESVTKRKNLEIVKEHFLGAERLYGHGVMYECFQTGPCPNMSVA